MARFWVGQRVRTKYADTKWEAENAIGYITNITEEGYTVLFDNGDSVSGFLDDELVLVDKPRPGGEVTTGE
jgi:hypothetical protein